VAKESSEHLNEAEVVRIPYRPPKQFPKKGLCPLLGTSLRFVEHPLAEVQKILLLSGKDQEKVSFPNIVNFKL
jgi:hypothetical protein